MAKERQAGLDLVRAAAIFFVVCLHGITMRGALDAALLTPVWCAKVFVRYLALSAVPLFLMLSGYLQNRKMPTVKYYVNYLHIYIPYLLLGVSLEDRALFLPYCRDGGQYPLFLFQRECCGLSFK